MKALIVVAVLLEAAVLLGLFLFMQFLRVRAEYKFCIKYSFFTKHIFNITSCSFKKEGIVTECKMNFRNYSLSGKLNELVERHFHELFKKEDLAGWLEELLDADVIVSPENREEPFALQFRKSKLLEVLTDFDEASSTVLKKYLRQGFIAQHFLKEDNEFLELFRDELVKEMHYIGMKPGDVISFCG